MRKKKRVLRNNPEKIPSKYRAKLSDAAKDMVVRQGEIMYITMKDQDTSCTLDTNDIKLIDENMDAIYLWLDADYFKYPHVSNIINFKYIKEVVPKMEGLEVTMVDGKCLKVSKDDKNEFNIQYSLYLFMNRLKGVKGIVNN